MEPGTSDPRRCLMPLYQDAERRTGLPYKPVEVVRDYISEIPVSYDYGNTKIYQKINICPISGSYHDMTTISQIEGNISE